MVWRPLSLDLAFVISQKLMGIHHGVLKKDKPDKRIFKVYQKFFLRSNEKVDGDEAVQNKRTKADLDGEVENEIKKLLTIFIAYILIVLIALLLKISSVVYKKGGSMSASNKLTF